MMMTEKETLERLYKMIPELRGGFKTIMLNHNFWGGLTDHEFRILYTLPSLQIRVTHKTMTYIETRRKQLGLNKAYQRDEKLPKAHRN